ncbi:DNA polymerase-4 [Actinobaculum suis]|uniref:DNA polymerase IV n=1 Tax=Actinobaculum suis TaxID=1657 RepID=A0A1G6ZCX5_9ACTO|nr:DNA polymerase IV [Actinobaculum suis]MDY5153890.1 DNA polymerase IV [Actinobaculum suis]SDE00371.1 DNA polymerase-4 [Actinobaculum suis]
MSRGPRVKSARHSWGTDDSDTPILHVDMDAFFVAVELLDHPELRGRPVAVGGQERGVVAAASYEARECGVNSAMPVGLAYRRCPQLVMLPVRGEKYQAVSARIMDILRQVTPAVEQVSVDEAFLDVSGARRLFGSPVEIAQMIRAQIRAQEGVPASVGIAATKHVAKIASAQAKPDGWMLISAAQTLPFLHSLPVGVLWGVGDRTRERLDREGVDTVGDLVRLGPERLIRVLGQAAGTHLYELAMGHDPRPVETTREEKSMGRETTFFEHVAERTQLHQVLLAHAHDAARRLRQAGLAARTVSIKVRFADFRTITRSATFDQPTQVAQDLYDRAVELLRPIEIRPPGLRLLGLRAEQLCPEGEGVQLAFDDDARRSAAEKTMDSIRARFGDSVLSPASLLGTKADPHAPDAARAPDKPGSPDGSRAPDKPGSPAA